MESEHAVAFRSQLARALIVVVNLRHFAFHHLHHFPPRPSILRPWMFKDVTFQLHTLKGELFFNVDSGPYGSCSVDWSSIWTFLSGQPSIREWGMEQYPNSMEPPMLPDNVDILPNLNTLHINSSGKMGFLQGRPITSMTWTRTTYCFLSQEQLIADVSVYRLTHLHICMDLLDIGFENTIPQGMEKLSRAFPALEILQYDLHMIKYEVMIYSTPIHTYWTPVCAMCLVCGLQVTRRSASLQLSQDIHHRCLIPSVDTPRAFISACTAKSNANNGSTKRLCL